jgi:intracellular septation protein A
MNASLKPLAALRTPRPAAELPMLVAAPDGEVAKDRAVSKSRVLTTLARRSLPSLLEATLIPALIFYVFLLRAGPGPAMVSVLVWSYGAVVRRLAGGHRIPSILMLAVLGLTVRTIVGFTSGTFMYFLQPVVGTLVLAAVFLGSVFVGRPIIGRLASDFCPLSPEIANRPAVLWAGVHLLSAATSFGMLVSLPTTTFVALKTVVSLTITISAIVLTVSWSIRTAQREELVFARVAV